MATGNMNAEKTGYRNVFRFALHYWKPGKWMGISAAGLMMAAVMMDSFVPVYTGRIVDAMTHHGTDDAGEP